MKTTATYQESYQPKRGLGARLVFIAFFLSLIGLSKTFAQVPAAPIATAADSVLCNSFEANWGSVLSATTYFIDVSTDSTFSSFIGNYNNMNVGNVTTFNVNGLLPGSVSYYRVRANDGTNTSLNSNTISVTTSSGSLTGISFNNYPSTNGNYNVDVTGLNTAEVYTLVYYDYTTAIADTFIVTNSSSTTITHHYPYDGTFNASLFLTQCGSSLEDTVYAQVNNSGCNAATQLSNQMIQNISICNFDSISFGGFISFTGLSGSGTSLLTVNWGDGVTDTYPIPHNGWTDSAFSFYGNPHSYIAPGTYTAIVIFSDPNACYIDTLIQSITIGSTTCGSLSGTIYSDINTNCSLDNGTDNGLSNILITATDGSNNVYYSWTDYNGNYAFNYLPNGSYTIDLGYLNQGYSVTCSGGFPQTVTVNNNTQVVNCPVTCGGTFDVAVTGISLMNGFFPGTNDAILPHVGLLNASCNQPSVSGQVMIILDACIQYTTSGWSFGSPAPDVVHTASTGDTLIWNVANINNIGTFGYFDYPANVSTCTSAQVGDSACITVMVLPTNGDADLSNNTFTRCFAIGVSYDPNSKEVSPVGVGTQGYIPSTEPTLTYTLNFQNTGTAMARNIYVMDTIDTHLNAGSIEILSASHRLQVYTLPNGVVKFMFADINLVDSTHDELNSHGYVTFKIKLNQGLTPGTQIKNTGYIYFDYNDPIVTNTTLNTIEFPTSVKTYNKLSSMKVYPNPAKESITILSGSSNVGTISVLDVLGKTVQEVKTSSEQTVIGVSELPNGVYFIKLAQDNMVRTEKILIAR